MNDPENKKYIKLGITGVAVVVVGMLCFFLLYKLGDIFAGIRAVTVILSPFVYGAVIAYILTPICNKFERLFSKLFHLKKPGLASGLSILLSLLLAFVIIWVLIMLVFPQVWDSIVSIANAIPGELNSANAWLHNILQSQSELQAYWDEFSGRMTESITKWLKNDLLLTVGTMVSGFGSQLGVFLGLVKDLFLGVLVSVYILSIRKRFAAQGRLLLNGIFSRRWADIIEEEMHYADRMFNGFLMGKLLDSAIIGVLCFIGTSLIGIKSAVLVSVIVGVTNIIPFFGPFIGAIPCALLLLLENPIHCLYFIIFVLILQQLDGNVIGPKILGNSTGLPSFWVMFAILLFGGLWGIVGMIVGVPLCAVLYDIVRKLVFFGLDKHGHNEMLETYNRDFHSEPTVDTSKKK